MTVEQLITRYTYQHKTISLQGIGTINMAEAPADAEQLMRIKDTPVSGLDFVYQPNVTTTPEFVKFYGEQRGKIASLATSDIQAFLQMAVQLLNIGNPFEIKGIGTLNKQNDGRLQMTPGYYTSFREGEEGPSRFKERAQPHDARVAASRLPDDDERAPRSQGRGMVRVLVGSIAAILILGAGFWIFSLTRSNSANDIAKDSVSQPDDALVTNTDTASLFAPDTTAIAAEPDPNTPQDFKAFFREEQGTERALLVQSWYKNNSAVRMETTDSMTYRFYVDARAAAVDTARVKDSLRQVLRRPVRIERKQ